MNINQQIVSMFNHESNPNKAQGQQDEQQTEEFLEACRRHNMDTGVIFATFRDLPTFVVDHTEQTRDCVRLFLQWRNTNQIATRLSLNYESIDVPR